MSIDEAMEKALKVLEDFVDDPRVQKEIDEASIMLRQALTDYVSLDTICQKLQEMTYTQAMRIAELEKIMSKQACEMGSMCLQCPDAQPKREPLTNEQVEKIIKNNMNLQMNLAGIKQDFESAYNIKEETYD